MGAMLARTRPIAMLTHSYYEEDPRVRREAESLVASGRPVDVYSLRRPGHPSRLEVDGVRVHRLDVQRHQGAGIATYLLEYAAFFARAGLAVARAHRHRRYALVQVHSLPDFLVFAALPLRAAGVPLLLDLHEAMPEFFGSRFPGVAGPMVRRVLLAVERASIRAASAVITVNPALADRLVRLGVPPGKLTVVPNSPALVRFNRSSLPDRPFMADGTLRLVYTGALTPIYEVDVAIRAMALLETLRPGLPVCLEVYGRGDSEPALRLLASELGLSDRVAFHGRVAIEAVPAILARADIGLAPTRRSPYTDFSLSTKIFEYGAMGKPVVASRLPLVETTFPAGSVTTYDPGDAASLASSVLEIVDDEAGRDMRARRMASRVVELAWESEGPRYVSLVERLARDGVSSSPTFAGRQAEREDG